MLKRSAVVDYTSSDDDDATDDRPAVPSHKKLRKLPSLSAHILPQIPAENPAMHQGRRRTAPHVEGQFAAYVYVPVFVSRQTKLYRLIRRLLSAAKVIVPSLHPIGFSEPSEAATDDTVELHISLTRPTYLRAHQRDDFRRAVQSVARSHHKFAASFVTVSELSNDERTRTFLTLEVGAGHDDLKSLSEGLGPALRSLRQKEFYESPRFHASVAWALLDGGSPPSSRSPLSSPGSGLDLAPGSLPSSEESTSASTSGSFPTIPSFPPSCIPGLRVAFDEKLVQAGVGAFEVDELHVKIGKETSKWKLTMPSS